MKKSTCIALALLLIISLLAGCGEAKPQTGTPSAQTPSQSTNSGDPSAKPPENDNNTKEPTVKTSGIIEYEPGELLRSFSDYIAAQDMYETDAVQDAVDMGKGNMMVMIALNSALLDANHCVFMTMYDDFMNSGKTMDGAPVTKQTNGDVTTWDTEKTIEVRESQASQIGDVKTVHISLDTKTNTLISEEVTRRGTEVIEKTVNKVVALSDGTVLSEFYKAAPSSKGDETVSTASVFRYNLEGGELECISGSFKTTETDFIAPSCLTADNIDRDAYLAFADPIGTVKVSAGTGEVVLP